MLGEKLRACQPVPSVDHWVQPLGKVGGGAPEHSFFLWPPWVSGQQGAAPFKVFVWSQHEGAALRQQGKAHFGQRTGRD